MDAQRVPWNYTLPNGNVAITMDACFQMLRDQGITPVPEPEDGSLWCNATYDTVLCWPPTPANTSIVLPCPPLKGLDPTRNITKKCHWSGKWHGRTENDFTREHGWTNFTMCYTDEVIYIMNNLNSETLGIAQEVAKNARKLEFVGLGLSLVSLIVSIAIFSYFRRLRVFRNMLHLHLMIAILMVVIIRLVLYIDLIFTGTHGPHQNPSDGRTINTMPFVCEAMYSLLEYFKTVAFGWMFLEGLHLHNQLVLTVFNSEPRLTRYLIAGYGGTMFGFLLFGAEFWILDGPRMAELVVNLFFICNVIRVLWSKVRESDSTSELDKMKKSVKAALMLIPLLGIPNIMQTYRLHQRVTTLRFSLYGHI
ncbi:Calcitonin receptor-like protein 1 [Parelaphostrongylus tenuis]|uniref:Calcitonin receptor-like protein 1 n=1 Tax=Parelaphostrongylus tenuis TaxID=148309 RepID=A0AAD5QWA9_PARTN|nr:Calcitonin receptor-like protein 1 [Parelaphostrongylus tenuis]